MAAVAGIMVALSVDELMPLAKEIDPTQPQLWRAMWNVSDGIQFSAATNGRNWLKMIMTDVAHC